MMHAMNVVRRRHQLPRGLVAAVGAMLWLVSLANAQEIVASPANTTGVYDVGQTVQWTVKTIGDKAADLKDATYVIKRNGLTVIADGKVDLSSGSATVESKLDGPGALLLELKTKAGEKDVRGLGGAVVAPKEIPPIVAPADFDSFWADKVKELQAVPVNAKLEPVDSERPTVDYFKLTMDNIRGSHVYGQIAKPKKEGKFPAILIVQWAGVYGLPKTNVTQHAEKGWLALNIMAHDLPFDQPAEFYTTAASTTLKNYLMQGAEDRDKSYFLRMYLACYRAVDYLASRDDWDGKTIVVTGTSQGGQQTLVTAGLHPKVTAAMANVPAGCDANGLADGRAIGFPYWGNNAKKLNKPAITEAARYYDAANFAARIKCPTLVSAGLLDETCPPAGVIVAFNAIKAPKRLIVMPESDHRGKRKDAQKPYFAIAGAWLAAIVKGDTVPIE